MLQSGLVVSLCLTPEQWRYTIVFVIQSFAHNGLESFFASGSEAGVQPAHAAKLRRQLAQLDQAASVADMNVAGWRLHPLKGGLAGRWSVWVSDDWRLTFNFDGLHASVVDYQDYH